MDNFKRIISVFMVVALCVAQVACTRDQIVTDIEAASAIVSIAATTPGLPPQYVVYLDVVGTALQCDADVVKKGGTAAEVTAGLAQCGLSAAAPAVPPGAATNIVNLISRLVVALQKILADQTQLSAAAQAVEVNGTLSFAGKPAQKKPIKVSKSEAARLDKVKADIAAAKAKLHAKKK